MTTTPMTLSSNLELSFTPMQLEYIKNANARMNFKIGATRSGKTTLDLMYTIPSRIIERRGLKGLNFILGVSKTTIERNILSPMRGYWGDKLIGEINSNNIAILFGEEVHCLGTEKVSQVAKLRGAEAKYVYWDEICEANEEVWNLAKSRLSLEYSVLDATANPKDPNHFIKKFIDRKDLDLYVQTYTIFDNYYLPKVFVDQLVKQYQGTIYYDRYILGQWKRAEGAIYQVFSDHIQDFIIDQVPKDITAIRVGIDFGGNKSAHAFVAVGYANRFKQVVVIDEQLISDALTPAELSFAFVKFAKSLYNRFRQPFQTYYDNAEPVLARGIAEACNKYQVPTIVNGAMKTSILDRIRLTTALMGCRNLKIMRTCKHLIGAFQDAVWDDKSMEDKRLDNGTFCVDILDAFEYCIERDIKMLLSLNQLTEEKK